MSTSPNMTRAWIGYLKNNKIVALQSNPGGKLNYTRKVTQDDVRQFLHTLGQYSDETIETALGSRPSTTTQPAVIEPEDRQEQNQPEDQQAAIGGPNVQPPEPRKKYDNSDAEDVVDKNEIRRNTPRLGNNVPAEQPAPHTGGKKAGETSYTPGAIKKRNSRVKAGGQLGLIEEWRTQNNLPAYVPSRPRFRQWLSEEFNDDAGDTLSERDVEAIFAALPEQGDWVDKELEKQGIGAEKKQEQEPKDSPEVELKRLKQLIDEKMDAETRKELWDALNNV